MVIYQDEEIPCNYAMANYLNRFPTVEVKVTVKVCVTCGAIVSPTMWWKHDEWHNGPIRVGLPE